MIIIIQHADGDRDIEHKLTGLGLRCSTCKAEMLLILQEPSFAADVLTGWWWCEKCDTTTKLKVESSMFM